MREKTPAVRKAEGSIAEVLRRHEQSMMAAVLKTFEDTRANAAKELESMDASPRMIADDYFASVALHMLFLQRCGADMETSAGGDAKRAAHLLRIGERIAYRHWMGDITSVQRQKKADRIGMSKEERSELAEGAQNLAFKTVLRALVGHASASDPDLRNRITASIEAYIARLEPQSELEEFFAERARSTVAAFVQQPD